jgi:glutathione S-transferase
MPLSNGTRHSFFRPDAGKRRPWRPPATIQGRLMRLYNSDFSPNCLRVRAVAAELQIDLEIVHIDLRAGDNRKDEFLGLNPNAKVPVLVDDDFALWESRAINAYLAGKRPEHGLYPDDLKKRAIVDQWSLWQAIHLGPAMQRIAFERVVKKKFGLGEPDESAIAKELKDVAQFLAVLDGALADGQWVAGDLSIADFALASTFTSRKAANISLEEFPNVAAWIERLEARPSWQAATAHLRT